MNEFDARFSSRGSIRKVSSVQSFVGALTT